MTLVSDFRQLELEGFFYDGKSSGKKRAKIVVPPATSKAQIFVEKDLIYEDDIASLNISSRLGNTPREIKLPDESLVINSDNNAVDTLCKVAKKSNISFIDLHVIETKGRYALFATGLVAIFTWFLFSTGIPSISKLIAFNIPYFEDLSENLNYFSEVDKRMFSATTLTSQEQTRLTGLFSDHSDQKGIQVLFRSMEDNAANAFAFPGKIIVITDGLIEMTDSDEELLAIYFHEEAHIKSRHLARNVIQNSFISVGLFLLFGDLYGFEIASMIPNTLIFLSYSREFEIEADLYSSRKLAESGLSNNNLVSVLQKLQTTDSKLDKESKKSKKVTDYWSTHPITEDRIRAIQQDSHRLALKNE